MSRKRGTYIQAHGTQNGTQRTKNPIPDVEMGFLVVMDVPYLITVTEQN
jgi:hypothetical protein